jgi:hypothetical protein
MFAPMKRKLETFAVCLLCCAFIGKAAAGQWKPSRPRLFFDPERIVRLRQQIQEEGPVKEAWSRLLSRADRLLQAEFVSEDYAERGSGQHGNYGAPSSQVSDLGMTLGLAYQVTGQESYAQKLRDALLYYAGYKRWGGRDFLNRQPPWHSELNTARFCHGYAVGYDCLRDFLSPDDRKTIAEAMIRLGILSTLDDWVLPGKRIHALDSMGHNWWSVCVAQAGIASLSLLGDDPRAEKWVSEVSKGFPLWFTYRGNVLQNKSPNFDPGGAFYESVGYANYALSEYLLFHLAYTNTFPGSSPPEIPLLANVGDFFLHTSYPTSSSLLSVNFGDHSVGGNAAATVRLLLANGFGEGKLQWYLDRTGQGFRSPFGFLYHDANLKAVEPLDLPTSASYPDIGWAMLRSSWEDDATLLAVKSGFTWNHAHADAGSFILFHAGMPLLIDSGTCSYGRREYVGYYCQSPAHNVVLFNGEAQSREDIPRGVKTPGSVHRLIDFGQLKYVYADATGPTAQHFLRNYRHFLWLGDIILVLDDLRAHTKGKLEWLLHYEGQGEKKESGVLLSNGPAQALVRPIFPDNLSITEREGLADHRPDEKVAVLSFSPENETREEKFLMAVLLSERGSKANPPRLEPLRGPEMIGVQISDRATVTEVYVNLRADGRRMHQNSNNSIAGWETDAYLLAVTRPEGSHPNNVDSITRCFVACGSYLRRGDKVVLESLSKVFAAFSSGSPDMKVILQGQPFVEAAVRSAQRPENLLLNGETVPVDYDAAEDLVRFSIRPR